MRNIEVATTCEADFDQGSEGLEACPADCGPQLQAYYDDCAATYDELAFLVIATDKDACFDVVFDFFASLRGSDCEMHRQAFRPMWPFVCMNECTEECSNLVAGVCNHCSGVLNSDEANSVELELSLSAPHCPQSDCSLEDGSSGGGGSSSGTGDSDGSSEDDGSSAAESSSSSGGEGYAGRLHASIAFSTFLSLTIASFLF